MYVRVEEEKKEKEGRRGDIRGKRGVYFIHRSSNNVDLYVGRCGDGTRQIQGLGREGAVEEKRGREGWKERVREREKERTREGEKERD